MTLFPDAKPPSATVSSSGTAAAVRRPTVALAIHGLLWVVVIICFAIGGILVKHGLTFSGVFPIPLRANPLLLSLGGIGLLFSCVCLGYFATRQSQRKIILLSIAVAAAVLSLCSVLGAIHPSAGTLLVRDRVTAPFHRPLNPVFAITIFFPNGDSHLPPDERDHFLRQFRALASCGSGQMYVRGFASSATFPQAAGDSNDLNKQLANGRAIELSKILHDRAHVEAKLAPPWLSYDAMIAARRIEDVGADGKRQLAREMLNRRAELFWERNNCEIPSQP